MDDKTRLELYNSGLNDRQIAEKVGVHRTSIRKWRSRMGLSVVAPYRKYPIKMIDTICDLYQEGKQPVEIAKITGISSSTIVNYLKDRGLRSIDKIRNHKINEIEICRLYHEGESISSISKITGNSRQTVSNLLEKRGLRKKPSIGLHSRLTDLEKTRFMELYNEGKNDVEIADSMGRSKGTVARLRLLGNLPRVKHVMSEETKYAMRQGRNPKYDERYIKSVQLYHKHKDWSFEQITAVVYDLDTEENVDTGLMVYPSKSQVSLTKTKIGRHLMTVCRSQEKCAFKPLLPETKMDEHTTNIRKRESKTDD